MWTLINPLAERVITNEMSVFSYLKEKNANIESETKVNHLIHWFDPQKKSFLYW